MCDAAVKLRFSELGELLNFADLGAALLFVKALECVLEEVGMGGEPRIFWDSVVVLKNTVCQQLMQSVGC